MNDQYPDFLPQWTNALQHIHKRIFFGLITSKKSFSDVTNKAGKKFKLYWSDSSCCLTGEAFFHEGAPLSCDKCKYLTFRGSMEAVKSLENLYNYKIELAEHLQQEHPMIWDMWKNDSR